MKKLYILVSVCLFGILQAGTKPTGGFIENKGQIHDQNFKPNTAVKYLLSIAGMNIQLKQNSFSYDTYTVEQKNTETTRETALTKLKHPAVENIYHFHRVDVEFIGANAQPEIIAEQPSETYYNYYTTGTSEQGATNVRSYEKVTYKNIYPNIDLEFIAKEGKMKYNFILHYGADMNVIKWKYHGANASEIKNTNISISVKQGEFNETIPESYITSNSQKTKQVKIDFIKNENGVYGFTSNQKINITPNQELVIDPTLQLLWSTFYGGTGVESITGSCIDSQGNTYYSGYTESTSAIATSGSHQSTYGGGPYDAMILKMDPSGSLLWATYYGGTGDDGAYNIVIDQSFNLFVSGYTSSTASISTAGSHQSSYGGGPYDGFLLKFTNTGSLIWGTYYGGNGDEYSLFCKLDNFGNVYLSGGTSSTNSISVVGAHQLTYGGGAYDGFLAKFNTNGVRQWATYYGNNTLDIATSCGVDLSNNVYLTGYTNGGTAISTPGSHQPGYGGGVDCYLVKFNQNGVRLWGTYYGASGLDTPYHVNTDSLSNVYIVGGTNSIDSISTLGTHQSVYGGCGTTTGCYGDGFLVKFDSLGVRQWGTYYGGTRDDACYFVLPKGSYVYMCGISMSNSAIAVPNTFQDNNINTYIDMMLVKFTSNGTRLWGTYLGDWFGEYAYSIVIDPLGNIYLSGQSGSPNFPVTLGCYQPIIGGTGDGVIVKFRESAIGTTIIQSNFIESEIIIYPNPNSGSFTLQTKEDVELEIVNELGQIVKTIKLDGSNNHQTTITGLADGVYCLKDKLSGNVIKNKIVVVK